MDDGKYIDYLLIFVGKCGSIGIFVDELSHTNNLKWKEVEMDTEATDNCSFFIIYIYICAAQALSKRSAPATLV